MNGSGERARGAGGPGRPGDGPRACRLQDWLDGRSIDDATLAEYLAARFEAGHRTGAGRVPARRTGPCRGQVAGIRWEQADATAAVAGSRDSVRGLRDAALLAVMSDGLLRISEAAALEVEGTNILTIRRLKTNQEVEGAVQYIGEPTVARVRAWIEGRVSGHSLRVRGAQSLAAAGASVVEMQTASRWQSPSPPIPETAIVVAFGRSRAPGSHLDLR